MIQAMKNLNFLQKGFRPKVLNQVFVIILMHLFQLRGDITVTEDNITDVVFKYCAQISK